MIERISPPGVAAPRGPYSPAVRAGDFIFVSGQVAVDPATQQLISGDIADETRQVLNNIKALIESCGATLADGAKMARESDGHTLQATALVHEAWLRLGADRQPAWENRAHFFAAAAVSMRR